jgi:DNA-binding NarL/FixJ family response regulator
VKLSPRQEQVAALVVQGMSNKAIGKALGIKHETVKIHMVRIGKKLTGIGTPRLKVFRYWYTIRTPE